MANIELQHNETEFETFEFIRSKNYEENETHYSYRSASSACIYGEDSMFENLCAGCKNTIISNINLYAHD